jgi:alpha-aminoadipic semialdehyde synthase
MKSLLIRAEDKNDWEKRTPLVPADLAAIIRDVGVSAYVEKSSKRFFSASAYETAGARLCTSMAPGDVIFGIKEIPPEKILAGKTYVFFSHTIKGQKGQMPLLKKIMDSGSTLIDYEKITDDQGRRLIYFGRFAGDAGALDILSLMGEYWRHHGIETPFTRCRRAHQYESVEQARDHLRQIGARIAENGLPGAITPLVIGVLGYGNVSGGAQQIFDCLPVERVAPDALASITDDPRKVYLAVFKEEDLVVRRDGGPFVLEEYYQHPEKYESRFDRYLPHLSIVVNAVYWESRYPRFVTWDGLKALFEKRGRPRLCGIADISCDVRGAVECTVRTTDSGMPAYLCDPLTRRVTDGHEGDGIVVLAVDNLPCELPADASTFFSGQLRKFVPGIVGADYGSPLDACGLPEEIRRAVIVYNGHLTEPFEYLRQSLE